MTTDTPADTSQAAPKKILVVMEGPEEFPRPATELWEGEFKRQGYEVTAIGKIVEAFSHLGFGDSKYDLVILDPLNDTIMLHGQMREPAKIAALGVLARAQRNGAQTICTVDRGLTEEHFDMNALRTHTTREVEHGNYSEMMEAVKALLPDGRKR